MIHDLELVERLGTLPQESFDGHVFRATSLNADPLTERLDKVGSEIIDWRERHGLMSRQTDG